MGFPKQEPHKFRSQQDNIFPNWVSLPSELALELLLEYDCLVTEVLGSVDYSYQGSDFSFWGPFPESRLQIPPIQIVLWAADCSDIFSLQDNFTQ